MLMENIFFWFLKWNVYYVLWVVSNGQQVYLLETILAFSKFNVNPFKHEKLNSSDTIDSHIWSHPDFSVSK